MQLARTVLISLCLVLPGWSALMKEHTHSSSAVSLLLRSQGPGKVDTKTLVSSLNEVAKGLHTEDKKSFDLAQKTKSDCADTDRALKAALNKGRHTRDMATNDYQKTDAQVNALQASLAELTGQVTDSNKELDSLQAQLKKLRTDKGLLKKAASKSLRQVEAVIAKTYLRDDYTAHHKGVKTALEKKVNSLEELSKSLSFLQAEQSNDEEEEAGTQAVTEQKQHSPELILKADKQAVVRASDATQRGFNEEEKKIIDLVEVERKKLTDLEDNVQDLQPAIADKLKQAMEINRTLDAAERGMERDQELMQTEEKKCSVISASLAKQKKARNAVANDVSMASKVLEHMDTALFLTKDLQGLKRVAPNFLQIAEHSSVEEPVARALSLLQEGDGMGLEELVENYDSSTSGNEGPFDSVTKMIGGLIASLKAQANEEVNQHQFCADSLGKNRRDRIAKKNTIDTLTSTIRWSKMAIVRLDDDLSYLKAEMDRLAKAQTGEKTKLTAETARVKKEIKEHKLADEVIVKCVLILSQLCDLKSASSLVQEDSPALIQRQSSKVGSRFAQCSEASKLLQSASKGVKSLDTLTNGYLKEYTTLSEKITTDAKAAQDARDTELKSTKAARAQRASELATSTKDVKEAAKELVLIQTAKEELEHSCTHVETREEKMARRQEEIDALKEALNVLQGEAVPA